MSYIVPIHRPSGVRLALKLNFVDPQSENVVVAKANRLEIYSFNPDGTLTLVHSRAVYGYIVMLDIVRPATSQTDHLFVGTDRHQYFTCSWDAEARQLKTEQSFVDQADKTLKSTRENDKVHIDPTRRFMTLEMHDGIVTVVPLVQSSTKKVRRSSSATTSNVPGTLGEPVSVRVEEISTLASAFLDADQDTTQHPRFGLLWEDNQYDPQLKVLELQYSTSGEQPAAELTTVAELRDADRLDKGVTHLIPVSLPYGGFLILGQRSIAYADSTLESFHAQPLGDRSTVWSCWTKVDDTRWLLADEYGNLYFLMLVVRDGSRVRDWKLDFVGQSSKAACLVYLDEGYVFIGSHSGDSQVVQIREGGVEVHQTFPNLAPILDLHLMDLGRGTDSAAATGDFSTGQARLLACSNSWQDGTIRSVRSGVGMEVIGEIDEIPLIEDMWALSTKGKDHKHDLLLLSFATETRVFRFGSDGSVEEVNEFCDVEFAESTLLAANLPDRKLLQVYDTGLKITDLESGMSIFQWKPTDVDDKLTGAAANSAQIVAVEGGHTLHSFHVSNAISRPSASRTFGADSQISSVSIPQSQSNVCVVSFWQTASVALLDLQSLQTISIQSLGTPGLDVPRSILVVQVLADTDPTLFISMADGTIITFSFDTSNSTLSGMTRILLGSEPVFLKALPRITDSGQKVANVFASCEQPSLIYGAEGRIIYSAINSDEAARVCPFDAEDYPGAIALASPTDLKLAMIDTARTTQMQTLKIRETVRCLAYQPKLKLFGICTVSRTLDQDEEQPQEELRSFVKLADEITFKEIDSFPLEENELVECITNFEHAIDDEMDVDEEDCIFIVGTSIRPDPGAVSQEDRGRMLVFSINSKRQKLNVVAEVHVRGACRSLAVADGLIVAGLVKVVVLYSLAPSPERGRGYDYALHRLSSCRTSTSPLSLSLQPATRDHPLTLAIGDLMKSLTVVEILPPDTQVNSEWEMKEVARHYATLWTSAVAAVEKDEWAIADMEGNLAMLRRNHDAYGEEKKRLQVTGEMRLGENVNKIVSIPNPSLPPSQLKQASAGENGGAPTTTKITLANDKNIPLIRPQAFVATVEGSIYMLGGIHPAFVDALLRIQACLATRVVAPGGMPWARYRAWRTDVREGDEPFRFVDGEMVEQGLLALPDNMLEDVLRESGLEEEGVTVADLRLRGEELRRLY